MKKILSLITCLLFTLNASAAITYVQSTSCATLSTYTEACAYTTNVTAASLLVVGCTASMTTNTLSVTDNKGDTFTAVGASLLNANGGGTHRSNVYYAKNAVGGATTVTCSDTNTTSSFVQLSIHEYSGADTVNPFDVTVSSNPATAGANPLTGAITTSVPNEMVFSMAIDMPAAASSQNDTVRQAYVFNNYVNSQDTILSSPGSHSPTWTVAGNTFWVAIAAAFKPPAGTGTFTIR